MNKRCITCDCEQTIDNYGLSDWCDRCRPAADPAAERKATPVFSGVLAYFPDALREVAIASRVGNEQHNPGTPLHWDRAKSGDELDALTRHLLDAGKVDSDGVRHTAKVAWRALAHLQKELELARGDYRPKVVK